MPSTTYLARRPGPFAALIQAVTLGGLRLDPLLPVRVRDRYFDTNDGALLREGLTLRVREADGRRTVGLRALDGTRRPLPADVDLNEVGVERLDLPPGPLARAVWDRAGTDRLQPLLSLRQYRTPRIATADGRPVGLVSFDVVAYEVPGAHGVLNEVEVEPAAGHRPDDAARLDRALRGEGLDPVGRSKFERGVLRLQRPLSLPVLLLPDERRQLREAVETAEPAVRRRAQVVLLDAEGFRPDTIAAQTGLSMAHIRDWRQRFRQDRLGILNSTPAAASPVDPLASAPLPEGDGAGLPADSAESQDMAALLEMFAPSPTHTPLLDDGPLADDEEAAMDDEEPVEEPSVREPSQAAPRRGGEDAFASPFFLPSYPVVLGPVAPAHGMFAREEPVQAPDLPEAVEDEAAATAPDWAKKATAEGQASSEAVQPLRRPALVGSTPLLHAAQVTVAYHVAAFEAAADRLAHGRTPRDAQRALIAVHRVRLALESFRPVLPATAVDRLLAALRPLAGDLDRALDASRAAAAYAPAQKSLEARASRALDAAVARLGGARQRAWGDRARRLLARLAEQRADGLLLGDDFPLPPDDFVGEPGDVPAPSRLRHALGSLLWARYEAVRAFEDEVEGGLSPDAAYHLAVATSALHFVLGLAARASSGPVREVADVLDAAESEFAAYRHGWAVAQVVAEAGGPDPAVPDAAPAADAWRRLTGPAFRQRLAAVAAGI